MRCEGDGGFPPATRKGTGLDPHPEPARPTGEREAVLNQESLLPRVDVQLFLEKLGDTSRVLLELDGVKVRVRNGWLIMGVPRYRRGGVLLTENALYMIQSPYELDVVTWTGHAVNWRWVWTLRECRHDHETLWIGSRHRRHPVVRGQFRLRHPRAPELAAALAGLVPPELASR